MSNFNNSKETIVPIRTVVDMQQTINALNQYSYLPTQASLQEQSNPPCLVEYVMPTDIGLQRQLAKDIHHSQVSILEHHAKTNYKEQKALESYEKKKILNAKYRQIERDITVEVDEDTDGTPFIREKNLLFGDRKRLFTNLRSPKIIIFYSQDLDTPPCYCMECFVGQHKKNIYFLSEKIGSGTYLLKKLQSAGIFFDYKPEYQKKDLILTYFNKLVEKSSECFTLPDNPGWYSDHKGNLHMAKEGDLTWKRILNLSK